jgi:hypothetical protein
LLWGLGMRALSCNLRCFSLLLASNCPGFTGGWGFSFRFDLRIFLDPLLSVGRLRRNGGIPNESVGKPLFSSFLRSLPLSSIVGFRIGGVLPSSWKNVSFVRSGRHLLLCASSRSFLILFAFSINWIEASGFLSPSSLVRSCIPSAESPGSSLQFPTVSEW